MSEPLFYKSILVRVDLFFKSILVRVDLFSKTSLSGLLFFAVEQKNTNVSFNSGELRVNFDEISNIITLQGGADFIGKFEFDS